MAARRSKRTGFLHPGDELEKLRPARKVLVQACTVYPPASEPYRQSRAAIEAIDAVAEAMIGDAQFFWSQQD